MGRGREGPTTVGPCGTERDVARGPGGMGREGSDGIMDPRGDGVERKRLEGRLARCAGFGWTGGGVVLDGVVAKVR